MTTYGSDVLNNGTAIWNPASGSYADADKVVDNNESTYGWIVISTPYSWWQYDLGAGVTKKVRKLRTKCNSYVIKDWVLYGSNNGSDFTQVASGTMPNSGDWCEATFANANAYRYYRLAFPGGSYADTSRIYIWEMEMMEGNDAPNTPSTPSGPSVSNPNVSCDFSVVATDPDGDNVYYVLDWGDGNQSTTSLHASGESVSASHSWSAPGTYGVKAYTVDALGASSGWSSTATIVIAAPGSYARVVGLW